MAHYLEQKCLCGISALYLQGEPLPLCLTVCVRIDLVTFFSPCGSEALRGSVLLPFQISCEAMLHSAEELI